MEISEVKELFKQIESKMDKSVTALRTDFQNMKAGRANAAILDKVRVNAYGQETPINQVGNISVPEARQLVIQVWDISLLKEVEKAILGANLGLTPNNDGKMLRINFPELTSESRKGLVKDIKSNTENTKVALRNARRDGIDTLKKFKKDNILTEDDLATCEKDVDKMLAKFVGIVDGMSKDKETEVMSV